MRCPICSNEMEQGFLQGNQRVAWVKNKHNITLKPKRGEVLLENKTLDSFLLTAWICKDCKKVVIDYADKDYQEG
ncbi:PF20097 family protein [Anaerotignum sp. MB30-C6]|uniref:PF20097 family protein n=1 Tax=Anaerotignum sp. MB30-C6 TaxID=3070814 RepID=UPI0027DAE89C|nr:PF20097 family protein [Anaerotignum sp. MB30-C6]WMI79965.1 PF20097 family protein [Anaerotignum sp. MB30-C6]